MKTRKETSINVRCERLSIHNKRLKSSGHETAEVFFDTKLAKPMECDKGIGVTIYGNSIEQIMYNIGSTDFNWSTHVIITTKDVSSKETMRISWEKEGIKYYFICELMHVWTQGEKNNRYLEARYNATSMYTLDSDENIHYLVKNSVVVNKLSPCS